MSDEEKKAIEMLRNYDNEDNLHKIHQSINVVLNIIEKQQKEIEHQKEKRENQKQELAILNAKQIEFNKLVNTVNSYEGQFKRQQKEIEKYKNVIDNREFTWKQKYEETFEYVNENFINKDKIKAKIEEYKKLINECPMNDEEIFCKDCTEKCGFNQTIDVLQSLLEKEVN